MYLGEVWTPPRLSAGHVRPIKAAPKRVTCGIRDACNMLELKLICSYSWPFQNCYASCTVFCLPLGRMSLCSQAAVLAERLFLLNPFSMHSSFEVYLLLTPRIRPIYPYHPSTHLSFPRRLVVLLLEEVTLDLCMFQLFKISVCELISSSSTTKSSASIAANPDSWCLLRIFDPCI